MKTVISNIGKHGFEKGERERMLYEYFAHKPSLEIGIGEQSAKEAIARFHLNKQHQTEEGDPLFELLYQNPKIVKRILLMSRFLTLFGLLFFLVGIVAFTFYSDKTALWLMGFISLLHVIGGPLGLISAKNRNRYLILIIAMSNVLWVFLTVVLIFFCLWIMKPGPEKKQFDEEIFLHVGLVFYTPISCLCAFYCYELLRYLHDLGLSRVSVSASDDRIENGLKTKKRHNWTRKSRFPSKISSTFCPTLPRSNLSADSPSKSSCRDLKS